MTAERVLQWIEDRLPRPSPKSLRRVGLPIPISKVIVVGKFPNPTYDYYLAARLSAAEMPTYEVIDLKNFANSNINPEGTFVIICRYANKSILAWLERNEAKLAGVALLLDDDIPAVIAGKEASISYRTRLLFNAVWPIRRLNPVLDFVWVSTPALARRLGGIEDDVMPPAPPVSLFSPAANIQKFHEGRPQNSILVAYHATAIHVEEHRFLQPTIKRVLKLRPHVRFEVFAGGKTRGIWRDIERVDIRSAVSWPDYVAEASSRRIDIMLVPLSPSRVNSCRADTKRIDVARFNAAAIYSRSPAYSEAQEGEILLPYEPKQWEQTLLSLIDNSVARKAAADATREKVQEMSAIADRGIGCLKSVSSAKPR
jgi:hypothetical protein